MNVKYKKILNEIQLITTNNHGVITFNDNNLFPEWSNSVSIFEAHPFFDIINSFDKIKEKVFRSVHFNSEGGPKKICDVKISFENSEIDIFIFDYTEAYLELNNISHERNESKIKSQELEFQNKLLVEKEGVKNKFIVNVNHELATPITSIKGFADLIMKTELDYEQEEIIKFIKSESEHLQSFFNDMLDISQIDSGNFKLKKEPFNFIEFIKSLVSTYEKIISDTNDSIVFNTHIDLSIYPLINEDKTRIYQIITNLLNNAIKYTDEGVINLSVIKKSGGRKNRQHIEIRIKDTGIGISKKDQEKIFQAFSQIDQAVNGIGMGLNITRNLVHLMKGTMEINSDLHEGAEFIVNVKLSRYDEIDGAIDSQKNEETFKLPEGKKYRILIIENRLNTQFLIMKQLIKNGAFFIDAVTNAEDALKNIEVRKYDLIICDIKLPGMSGLKFASFLRKSYSDSFISKIPIIGVSAISNQNINNKAISAGMNAYIPKPYSEDTLINKITKLLTRK